MSFFPTSPILEFCYISHISLISLSPSDMEYVDGKHSTHCWHESPAVRALPQARSHLPSVPKQVSLACLSNLAFWKRTNLQARRMLRAFRWVSQNHSFALCSSGFLVLLIMISGRYTHIQGSRSWSPWLCLHLISCPTTGIRFSFPSSCMDGFWQDQEWAPPSATMSMVQLVVWALARSASPSAPGASRSCCPTLPSQERE